MRLTAYVAAVVAASKYLLALPPSPAASSLLTSSTSFTPPSSTRAWPCGSQMSGSQRYAIRSAGGVAPKRRRCACNCPCSTKRSSLGGSSTTRAGWTTRETSFTCSAWTTRPIPRRATWWTKASSTGGSRVCTSRPYGARTGRATRQVRCMRSTMPYRPSSSPYSMPTSCPSAISSCGRSPSSRIRASASFRAAGHISTRTSHSFAATRHAPARVVAAALHLPCARAFGGAEDGHCEISPRPVRIRALLDARRAPA